MVSGRYNLEYTIEGEQWMFAHIPKCGGMAIMKPLLRFQKRNKQNGHLTSLELKLMYPQAKTFTIIRNPWERFVSFYHYIQQTRPEENGLYKEHYKVTSGRWDFKMFVYHAIQSNDRIYRPQIDYVNSADFVIQTEDMEAGISELFKQHISIPRFNTSIHKHYSEYYDDELINLVGIYEQGIIEKYNYKFD